MRACAGAEAPVLAKAHHPAIEEQAQRGIVDIATLEQTNADLIATIEGFSRQDVDAFAVHSQQRAEKAWVEGRFDGSIVPVRDMNGVVVLDHGRRLAEGTARDIRRNQAVIGAYLGTESEGC